ncbi:TIR domain-containing protein [Corallococcus interemptor]|uniref:TIR domain-containing protein n=1 Tax=Corallococcus interemptor TaxID=2316720 RepID=A0A3A8Q950_9BACT|nr:TIR domain-containing protein [Corallococcus interemptor]RKH65209.1 TIR domain-containing protein [Corallococcus interemptor]
MDTLAIARQLVEELSQEQPDALELACLASFAVRAEPALLRRLRLELLPGSSPALEADLWLSELVGFRGPQGIVFAKNVGAVLRQRLAATSTDRYEQVWRITEETHRWIAPALQLEEKLNYLQFCRAPDAHAQTLTLLRSALATLVREPEGGLGHWAAGASDRLPQELMHLTEGRLLASAAKWSLGGELLSSTPALGEGAGWLASIARKGMERVRLPVKLFSSHVELGPEGSPSAHTLEIPRTEPLLVDVAEAEVPPRPLRVFISYSRRDDFKWVRDITQALRTAGHKVLGEDKFSTGESLMSAVQEKIHQSDVAILLVSGEALANEWNSFEARALLERKRDQGEHFTLIPVYLGTANPEMLARRWPSAAAILSIQGVFANRTSPREAIPHILEALKQPATQTWRRVELSASRPTRIALREGHVRLRTLLGDEHRIEPKEAFAHLRMPPPPRTFLGYEHELSRAIDLLRQPISFFYLYGPSGSGKTSLIRLAADVVAREFPDGIFYLERRKGDPPFSARAVAREVLAALGVDPGADHRDVLEQYYYQTSERRFVLVLDGLSSPSVEEDLPSAELEALHPGPEARLVLVCTHEARWTRLAPSIPMQAIHLDGLDPSTATRLLRQFVPHPRGDALSRLAEACGHLPGPLRSVAEALSRPSIHVSSLHDYATYLEEARLLSVLTGDFDLEAARAVMTERQPAGPNGYQALETFVDEPLELALQEMVRMGLVRPTSKAGRFMLWAPIQQVAKARPGSFDLPGAELRHANHFTTVLSNLDRMYRDSSNTHARAIEAFDNSWPDMTAAIQRMLRYPDGVVHDAWSLSPLIRLRRPPGERERWQKEQLRRNSRRERGHSLNQFDLGLYQLDLGLALMDLGHQDDAQEQFLLALNDTRSGFHAHELKNNVRVEFARLRLEQEQWRAARDLVAHIDDRNRDFSRYQQAQAHYVFAILEWKEDPYTASDVAGIEFELWNAWSLARDAADVRLEVDVLLAIAGFEMEQDALGEAEARLIEALDVAKSFRDDRGFALASWELGRLRIRQGNPEAARELLQRQVDYRRDIGHAQARSTAEEMERLLVQA